MKEFKERDKIKHKGRTYIIKKVINAWLVEAVPVRRTTTEKIGNVSYYINISKLNGGS